MRPVSKNSGNTRINDDPFDMHKADRNDRPFNPYTTGGQPVIPIVQNDATEREKQVKGKSEHHTKTKMQQIQPLIQA